MKLKDILVVFILWNIANAARRVFLDGGVVDLGSFREIYYWGRLGGAGCKAVFWIALPLFLVAVSRQKSLKDLGFVNVGLKRILLWAAVGTAAIVVVHLLAAPFKASSGGLAFVRSSLEHLSLTQVAAAMVLGGDLISPIGQEIFFRGMFQRFATENTGKLWGLLITALFFAFWHGEYDPFNLGSHFLAGLVFGYLYQRTGSLYPSILCHCAINFSATAWNLVAAA